MFGQRRHILPARAGRWLLLLWALALALLPGPALAGPKDLERASATRWALLIGVDKYEDPAIHDLSYAGADARALARQLVATGDWREENVIIMTPDQADPLKRPTRANIIRQLEALDGVPGGMLFFAFSGHGVAERDADGRTNLLLPMDAVVNNLGSTALTLESVQQALERTNIPRRFLVFDACRSDFTSTRALGSPWVSPGSESADGTIVLYGTRFGGVSFEDDDAKLGALTASLIEALSGSADGRLAADGQVSWNEACLYVQDRLRLRSVHTGELQEPTCGGEWSGGDFGLVRTPAGMTPIVARQDWSQSAEPTRHVARFASQPEGATIYVDGNELCTTPCQRALVDGAHVVETRLRRYASDRRSFEVAPGASHSVALSPLFGTLVIDTAPTGLRLNIDGEYAGRSPMTVELDPGTYKITIDEDGWMPGGAYLTLRAAERRSLNIPALPRVGALRVEARDPRGDDLSITVFIDGRSVGTTPWRGEVQVGPHRVLVGTEARDVVIRASEESSLDLTLQTSGLARSIPISAAPDADAGLFETPSPDEDADLFEIPSPAEARAAKEARDREAEAAERRAHRGLQLPSPGVFLRLGLDEHRLSGGEARYDLWAGTAEGEDPTEEQEAALDAYSELEKPTLVDAAPLNVPVICLDWGANTHLLRYGFLIGYGWSRGDALEFDGLSYNLNWAFQLGLHAGLQVRVGQTAPYLEYRLSGLGVYGMATGSAGSLDTGLTNVLHGPRLGTEIGFGKEGAATLDLAFDWLLGPAYEGFGVDIGVAFGGL